MNEVTVAEAEEEERTAERVARPDSLRAFVGQSKVRGQLQVMLDAARNGRRVPEHVLFCGPPGLGKTTLAGIVAAESGSELKMTSGPTLQSAGDMAAVLCALTPGEVLFVDEIHRMGRPAQEMTYLAMEDARVDVMVGKGANAVAVSVALPPFTLVGATTHPGTLPQPMLDRFGFVGRLEYYDVDELVQVVMHTCDALGVDMPATSQAEVAKRGRGTPRVVNRLVRRVRDYASAHEIYLIGTATVDAALALYDVDSIGLDRTDRAVLGALTGRYAGRPVGLGTLALAIGEDPSTIEGAVEPYLVRIGFVERTPRGREATKAAYEHMGVTPPRMALIR